MTTIASVVEGDGAVRALPVLVRTLAAVHGVAHVDVPRPFRLPRAKFLIPEEFARAIELQARRVAAGGVIAVLDADDCAIELVDRIRKDYHGSRHFRLVAAVREYESIFLPGLTERDPESVRGGKELLRTATGVPYRETVHQAKLSAALNLDRARECRWFRKFEMELLAILHG